MSADAQTMHDAGHDEQLPAEGHDHEEEIHLPPNSIAPLIVGVGMVLVGVGLLAPVLGVIGVVVLLGGLLKMADFPVLTEPGTFFGYLNDRKLGMWAFITSEVMFFTALIGTFIAFKLNNTEAFEHAHEVLSIPLATIGTSVLIISSFAVVMGLEALQSNDRRVFFNYMALTAVFGIMFLSIQAIEWYELFHDHITEETIFGTTFFTTTGFHGLHVTGGVVWLLLLLRHAWRKGDDWGPDNALSVELFGLYWHFVDVVWIVLFTIIYLIR